MAAADLVVVSPLRTVEELDEILVIDAASFTNAWTREMYLAELDHQEVSRFLLARDGAGVLVGYCTYWQVLDEVHINNLAVLPDKRRQGTASRLIERLMADAGAHGVSVVRLEVRRSNAAARALYLRFGFSLATIRPGYYARPVEDALVLEKRLATVSGD